MKEFHFIMSIGLFNYGPYNTTADQTTFWQTWENNVVTGTPPVVTVAQKTVLDAASTGFSAFLNRTLSIFTRNPLLAALPFLYPDSIVPGFTLALRRNAATLGSQFDPNVQRTIDGLSFVRNLKLIYH
jgi:hypothetical protein